MSTHKSIDRICVAAVAAALLICILAMNGEALGIRQSDKTLGYETKLFDKSLVHSINIDIDDWDSFLDTCESEKYSMCTVTVDGEKFPAVAIRGKGNTSLSNVSQMDSERYSFKLEFDHYDDALNYYGLDKLCLNNIIQDNTYMKDYLAYTLMSDFGVDAPLCSYAYITVNGEDWGLYLAVEGVEDSFLTRNSGGSGELYKPDSMSFGGGKGNGKDFNMDDFLEKFEAQDTTDNTFAGMPAGMGQPPEMSGQQPPEMGGQLQPPEMSGFPGGGGRGGFNGGMGDMGSSNDAKLQYIDDDEDSYSNIFSSAKTDVSKADKKRLIKSLKKLSECEDLEDVLDIDKVLRYFVVHNFLVNGDSYTGSMIHNYYLCENDGRLSMIPWDYNLAFGTFRGGDASSAVNDPIDDVLDDRPMQSWIFSDETYTDMYHELFAEFIESADIDARIDEAYALITPYVEKDPTKFCTYEEFETGVSALRQFCSLRSESVSGQLTGTVPSTSDEQQNDGARLIDASELTISDMGTMGGGMGGEPGQMSSMPQMPGNMSEPPGSIGEPLGNMGEPPGNMGEPPGNAGEAPEMPSGGMQSPGAAGVMPGSPSEEEYQVTWADHALLCISFALLVGGIIVAVKYRKRTETVTVSGQINTDCPENK